MQSQSVFMSIIQLYTWDKLVLLNTAACSVDLRIKISLHRYAYFWMSSSSDSNSWRINKNTDRCSYQVQNQK